MKKNKKVIITCAVTGAMHTPTMSDALPITPKQIANESVKAADAGASIIHLHARDPYTGQPTGDPDVFMQFLPEIKQHTDAVINLTTGGSPTMSVEERLACAMKVKPEMCSLNMGSINFAMFPLASRYKTWKHSWEEDYVRNSDDFIFRNTFRDIEKIMTIMSEHGTKFEHECYDVGHLYNLAHFADRGLVKPPFFIQTIFGILGGIGADEENLMYMKSTADRLFGDDYQWSVLAAGKNQMPFSTQTALMGGNVRVGLEDSLFIGKGQMAQSNAQQVEKIKRVLSEFSLEIATPEETRSMLGLKGKDNVDF
ncbi:BKACE family enzyme [Alteromonas australica]|uniref:3-keto-5-aminohexanoate cleavage protein n=1 Tax=Alteromonas australica TaxID=589873 RepID=UPI0035C7D399